MKHKLKLTKLVFIISLAGLLLVNCDKEEAEIPPTKQKKQVKHLRFEDLIGQEKFHSAITKTPKIKKGS